jgi:hypothetical protein
VTAEAACIEIEIPRHEGGEMSNYTFSFISKVQVKVSSKSGSCL